MSWTRRGWIWSQPRSQRGVSSTHNSWSVCPSGWQLAHAKVPVLDASALLKAMRPRFRSGSVGSSSAMVASTAGAAGSDTSTTDTLFPSAFSTQARDGAPAAVLPRATSRGMAPTSARPSTAPVSASTVNTRLDAAAVTTRVESSPLTAMPNGVARASSRGGSAGGRGSSSKNAGAPQPAPHATRVMRFRKARFSSSAMPWPWRRAG